MERTLTGLLGIPAKRYRGNPDGLGVGGNFQTTRNLYGINLNGIVSHRATKPQRIITARNHLLCGFVSLAIEESGCEYDTDQVNFVLVPYFQNLIMFTQHFFNAKTPSAQSFAEEILCELSVLCTFALSFCLAPALLDWVQAFPEEIRLPAPSPKLYAKICGAIRFQPNGWHAA